jgi:hypothetical protein
MEIKVRKLWNGVKQRQNVNAGYDTRYLQTLANALINVAFSEVYKPRMTFGLTGLVEECEVTLLGLQNRSNVRLDLSPVT